MRLRAYAQCLSAVDRDRYFTKVRRCGGVDPLALRDDELTDDVWKLPSVDRADTSYYVIYSTSFITREQLKSYTSLESHTYLMSGFVHPPKVKFIGDRNVVVVTKVRHSESFREKLLTASLLQKPDGEVVYAHCTCMAGCGEVCSHVGAALFYLEAVVTRRGNRSCTEGENARLPPHLVSLDSRPIAEMDIASSAMKKTSL
ncbi:hypothetical protein HPB48_020007 [Haemaphysalis longicornis]|uniref:SWIM-type domain-containing protein n=1 Tax=Haemaphysalis longicornis TaxID=44386 RepID=A0A9J6GTT8_HAELO|nr:hypothetical protein HPB48_020007 [Haemaphysalis longicornis]